MKNFDIFRFFGNSNDSNSASKRRAKKQRRGRACRIEELENREMLSVNPLCGLDASNTFDEVAARYDELDFGSDWKAYNIIEITADSLTNEKFSDDFYKALNEAKNSERDDIIVIRTDGTYNTVSLGTALNIDLDSAEWGSVTIVSLGDSALTIDSAGRRAFRIADGAEVVLAGLIIEGGDRTATANPYGGGIWNEGILTITECTITGNKAQEGGGIYNANTLTIINCEIIDNSAFQGGAIFNAGTLTVTGGTIAGNDAGYGGGICNTGDILAITDGIITDNTADGSGGGIYNYGTGIITIIDNCDITSNKASGFDGKGYGGAIYNDGEILAILDSTIADNGARYGGGIFNTGVVVIGYGTITGNTAEGSGGGIWSSGTLALEHGVLMDNEAISLFGGGIYNSGTLTLEYGTLMRNVAVNGGGIYNNGTSKIKNSLIAENDGSRGGGIHNEDGTLSVWSSTIAGNSGGILNRGGSAILRLYNTIVAANTDTGNDDVRLRNGKSAIGFNNLIGILDDDGVGTTLLEAEDGNFVGTLGDPIDPMFIGLIEDEEGVEYFDYHLAAGSLAIKNGNPSIEHGMTDLDGDDRTHSDGSIDIGAYQYRMQAPTGVKAEADGMTIIVTWKPVVGATEYTLQWRKEGMDWDDENQVEIAGASYTHDTGLEPSTTYYYRVKVVTSAGESNWSAKSNPVTTGTIELGQPVITETSATATTITVTWGVVDNASGYTIEYRRTAAGKWLEWQGGYEENEDAGLVMATITGLDFNTTYFVRVLATGINGYTDSEWSEVVDTTTLYPQITGVKAARLIDRDHVRVTWNRDQYATGYIVQCATDSEFMDMWHSFEYDSNDKTSYVFQDLEEGNTYYFRVIGVFDGNESEPSETAIVEFLSNGPENVIATPDGNTITVTWDKVDDAIGYEIEWWSEVGNERSVVQMGMLNTDCEIKGLAFDTDYTIKVRAIIKWSGAEQIFSKWSAETTAKTGKKPVTPGVKVPDLVAENGGTITPNSVTKGETFNVTTGTITNDGDIASGGYIVLFYASTSLDTLFNSGIYLGSKNMSSLGIDDTTTATLANISTALLEADEEYYIGWKIVDVAGETDFSNNTGFCETQLNVLPDDIITLETPTGLAEGNVTANSVELSWEPVTDADGYEVRYRKVNGNGVWSSANDTIDGTAAIISGLDPNTPYEFQVRAVNAEGVSGWTGISVTTKKSVDEPPAKPELEIIGTTSNSITLKWNWDGNADLYELQYIAVDLSDWETIYEGTGTSYTHENLPAGTYTYRLIAMNEAGESEWSDGVPYTRPDKQIPTPPKNVKAEPTYEKGKIVKVTITWDANTEERVTEYVVQRSSNGGNTWDKIKTVPATEETKYTYEDKDIADATGYTYRVIAVNVEPAGAGEEPHKSDPSTPTNTVRPQQNDNTKAKVKYTKFRKVKGTTPTSCSLKWRNKANVTSYQITCISNNHNVHIGEIWWDSAKKRWKVEITGLTPGTKYKFALTFYNGDGELRTKVIRVKTPHVIGKKVKVNNTGNDITLNWKETKWASTYSIDHYEVTCSTYDAASGTWTVEKNKDVTGTSVTFTDLDSGVKYKFEVVAVLAHTVDGENVTAKAKVKTVTKKS